MKQTLAYALFLFALAGLAFNIGHPTISILAVGGILLFSRVAGLLPASALLAITISTMRFGSGTGLLVALVVIPTVIWVSITDHRRSDSEPH